MSASLLWSRVMQPDALPYSQTDTLSITDVIEQSHLSHTALAHQVARFLGVPYVSVITPLALTPPCLAKHAVLLTQTLIGISDPTLLLDTLSEWQTLTHRYPAVVCLNEVERARLLSQQHKLYWLKRLASSHSTLDIPSLARFCQTVSHQARATDVQVLPQAEGYQLTHRIDGLRTPFLNLPTAIGTRLIRHWMLQAHLDYTQQDPQDGTLSVTIDKREQRLRLHACPTDLGTSLALRLPRHMHGDTLSSLLFEPEQTQCLNKALAHSHGLLLVTGPTGSGKTHSLYCFLRHLAEHGHHVITLEDPVEHHLADVTQIPVRNNTTLSYQEAMSHALRQDPDAIMIGEIRDRETAQMALQAAQTGHLVLGSCHTSHSLATCDRLLQLGMPVRQLMNIPTTLIAQRLLRCYCTHCHSRQHTHCLHCQAGYRGRRAVFECLTLTPALIDAIDKENPPTHIKQIATSLGTLWLSEHAERLVSRQITSRTECQRVLGSLMASS